MTEMPERIWAFDFWEGNIPRAGDWTDERSEAPEGAVEYIRADLIPAAAPAVPEVRALVEAVRDVLTWDHESGRPIPIRHRYPLLRALADLRGEGRG